MALKKLLIMSLLLSVACAPLQAEAQLTMQPMAPHNKATPQKRKKRISFNFENEDLTTIVNYLAAEKKVNIILPPAPNTLSTKVTLKHQKKFTIEEAFKMLNTLLDMSGYIMLPHGNTYIISRTAGAARETLPIYIGIAPEELPNSDEPIRYLYYFDNIKIPAGATGQAQDIKSILEDMLQDPAKPGSAQIIFDSATNCVIITAKSYSIKTAMQIIEELDKTGFREVIEIVQLANTNADFVGKFLMEQLLTPAQANSPLPPLTSDTSFFAKTTKVIPDIRSNSLIILGRTEAVNKLKNFIYEYIDIPLESGDSLVHVYELQYLDAQKFAVDLQEIIKPREVAGQAKGSSTSTGFQGVIIEAEKPGEVGKLQTQAGDVGVAVQGGNRLIIAAKKSDWGPLKKLIESLDKPQPQIALEILIADISLQDAKSLGSQIRNKGDALPKNVNFQFAGLGNPVVLDQTVQQNLLAPNANSIPGGPVSNLANTPPTPRNSFILSFNDPLTNGIWWVMDLLKNFESTKILSHPHIITLNQVQAKVEIADNRLADGPVNRNPDGSVARLKVNLVANLTVEILPRINLSNSINLQIAVKVNNFISLETNAKNTRTVITNATIGNGEVLVLGGLVKTSEADTEFEVPILGKIPIVGWLFKSRFKRVAKDNLMVFISPTIIKPKLGGGMSETSAGKFAAGKAAVEKSEVFEKVKDPITHWFFKSPKNSTKGMVYSYEKEEAFKKEQATNEPQNQKLAEAAPAPRPRKKRNIKAEQKNNEIQQLPQKNTIDEERLKTLLAGESNPLKKSFINGSLV